MIKNGALYYRFDAAQYLARPKTATCHKMGVIARLGDVAGSITARFHLHHSGFGGEVLNTSSHPPSSRSGWKKGLAGIGATALVAGTSLGGIFAAVAAPTTFNPFDINNGFTIVSQGNAYLNNGEIEGSITAFGSISSGNNNGYPVIHNSAAGLPDYEVPAVDGTPVRILAEKFVGTGAFDISNRDDSGTIDPGSPEATAVVKLVDIDGLTGSARGGGAGPAAGSDFLRVTNPDDGIIDLKTVPFEDSDVANYQTQESSVSAYFPDLDAQVAQTNQCLAAMYDPELGLTNPVTIDDQGGMVFVAGFAPDRPNVVNYGDIAGKTIKIDNPDGYKPTAEAPLVVRVPADTTELGQLRFEGWSPQAGAEQDLARYILLDLSAVDGDVEIDGLELGAIWAPDANLNFNSGITTNGQWFARDVTTAGGGEIHHHAFLGNLPCADLPVDPDPVDPSIGTTVAVDGSDEKVLPLTGGTVIDTVAYTGLTPGEDYLLEGEIRTAPAGEETGITATATFTPEEADGTTTVEFEISAEDIAEYAGQDLVVYEYLTLDGEPVAEHADPEYEAQTFTVAEEDPVVPVDPWSDTIVAVDGSDTEVLPLTGGTVIDTVEYKGLTPGETYLLTGEIRTSPDGEATEIEPVTANFTPEEADGTTTVEFEISAEDIAEYAGQDLVVYEYLTLDGEPVAEHADPEYEAQTFTVAEEDPVVPVDPWIDTIVAVDGSDTKVLALTGGTVIDTVAYTGLTPGEDYLLEGEIYTPEGVATSITASAEFTPETADGTTDVIFNITAEQVAEYAGQDLVVFEYLFVDGEQEPVAEHADPTDEAQTFTVAEDSDGTDPEDEAQTSTVAEEDPVVPVDPWIGTTVAVDGSDEKVLPLTGGIVIDTVEYKGLTPGEDYLLEGEIRTAPAGEETGITADATFTPEEADGTTTVEFVISAEDIAAYAGQDLVVYEYLTLDG